MFYKAYSRHFDEKRKAYQNTYATGDFPNDDVAITTLHLLAAPLAKEAQREKGFFEVFVAKQNENRGFKVISTITGFLDTLFEYE